MSTSQRRKTVMLAVCVLIAGVFSALVPAQSAGAAIATTKVTTSIDPATGATITTTKYSNGDVMRVYGPGKATLSGVSQTNTAVDANTTLHGWGGTLSFSGAAANKAGPAKATVYDALNAMDRMDTADGTSASSTSASDFSASYAENDPSAASSPNTTTAATMATSSDCSTFSSCPIIGQYPVCVEKWLDSNHLHVRGCDTQRRVGCSTRACGSGSIWYIEDEFQFIGTMHDTCTWSCWSPDEVTGLQFGVSYPSNDALYNVDPSTKIGLGDCKTEGASLEYQGVGVSISHEVCPETWGLQSYSARSYVTKWDGQGSGPNDDSRETHGVDAAYSRPYAARKDGISWYVWWE